MKINKNVSGRILTSAKIDRNGDCHYSQCSLSVKLNKVHRGDKPPICGEVDVWR